MMFVPLECGVTLEDFGLIPTFLDENDERPAREQFNERYGFGGGWRPLPNCAILPGLRFKYPGDPPLRPLAVLCFRHEKVVLYPGAVVAIIQENADFEVCRMD